MTILSFRRRFAPLFRHPNLLTEGPYPDIVRIRRMPGDKQIVGEDWHTDTTCMAEPPCGAVLYGVDVPPYGGDTLFANQYLAYETLSDGMKALLSGLTAVHSDITGAKAGLVVRCDAAELTAALVALLGDANLRTSLGFRGKALAASKYSQSAVTRDVIDTYNRVVN